MPLPMINQGQKHTYADYLTWPEGERWELIDGVPYMMSPAPTNRHQDAQVELLLLIDRYLKGKPCTVRPAPQDVRFGDNEDTDTVVQPDLTIWCKKSEESVRKDWLKVVVEILSPSTMEYDLSEKRDLYERQSVPEYWMVSLEKRRFMKYVLTNGKYERTAVQNGDFTSELFPGLAFNVEESFANVDERA